MARPLRIVITSGDADGIGLEVTSKALYKLKPQKNVQFILWRSLKDSRRDLRKIDQRFKRVTVKTWPEAMAYRFSGYKEIVDIKSNLSPAHWVEKTTKASLFGHVDALVTAPLSKTAITESGFSVLGHTGMFEKICKTSNLNMAFIGKEFNVLLATGHIPLKKVSQKVDKKVLKNAIKNAQQIKPLLNSKLKNKPLALVGFNPHSGEEGLIGAEEKEVFAPLLSECRRAKIDIEGPLVPDVAFSPKNWSKYAVYICPYHDQGLIPFKMVHGQDSGVHLTTGLPFIRTSVDHGCAKDIFGKDKANPQSMFEALELAIRLAERRRKK